MLLETATPIKPPSSSSLVIIMVRTELTLEPVGELIVRSEPF